MKKTYINPEMVAIKVQTQQMLATSGIDVETNVAGLSEDYADEGAAAGARGYYFDED